MTHYLLFAFDLDGTLLGPSGTISPDTLHLVRSLSRTARITIATGRSLASAWRYVKELAVTTPAILYHGAVVFDPVEYRPLREDHVPGELALRAFKISKEFPVHPQIYRAVADPTVYTNKITPPIIEFVEKEDLRAEAAADIDRLLAQGPLKLLFIGDPRILAGLAAALREEVPALTVVRSERNYIEALPPGISKGDALSWLCDQLGIPLSRTVAVGDQESDISMIERAGLGVAMANGAPELRARAAAVIARPADLRYLITAHGEGSPPLWTGRTSR